MLKEFCEFCNKRRNLVFFTFVVTALVFGFRIFSQSVTIDTDLMINMPGYMYNWLDIGTVWSPCDGKDFRSKMV